MARITRQPLAAADILDIWDYIAEDSIEQADRWVDRLDEKLELLATQPLMGRARAELDANVRSFPFGRYVVFYAPIKDGIDVVRVLHAPATSMRSSARTSRSRHRSLKVRSSELLARLSVERGASDVSRLPTLTFGSRP